MAKVTEKSNGLRIKGRTGTWGTIDKTTRNGKEYFLLESEQWGDETAALIVTSDGTEIGETFDSLEEGLNDEGIY